jgi:hypothetical protein
MLTGRKIARKFFHFLLISIIFYGIFYFNGQQEIWRPRKRCPGCPGNYFEIEAAAKNSSIARF